MKITSITLALATILLTSCGGGEQPAGDESNTGSAALSGSIAIDGSSTVFPITEAVAEEFRSESDHRCFWNWWRL
jgi:phosphate transport system substrate-binding protein